MQIKLETVHVPVQVLHQGHWVKNDCHFKERENTGTNKRDKIEQQGCLSSSFLPKPLLNIFYSRTELSDFTLIPHQYQS